MTASTLDLKGLKCPLPALRTAKALDALPVGARMIVLATDGMSVIDIPHLLHERGHRLIAQSSRDGVHEFVIERGRSDTPTP